MLEAEKSFPANESRSELFLGPVGNSWTLTKVVETTRPKFVYYRSNVFWMDSNLEIEGWMSEEQKLVLQTPIKWWNCNADSLKINRSC
jgi:hypothetical protein